MREMITYYAWLYIIKELFGRKHKKEENKK